jgi:short-subunit dehydrogenase
MELRGANALLTGAAGGLGGYIARSLATEGVNLALSDLPEASVDDLLSDLRDRGLRAESVPANLAERSEAEAIVGRAEEALGPLDILVNNAGVEFAGPFVEKSAAELEMLVQVNLTALMLTTRAALPGMLARGRGHVVNVASMAGKATFPFLVPYCASKHGVVGFTHALRAEHGGEPVGFSAICPGFISRVGMYGRFEDQVGDPPGPVGALPPERVGEAVVKAIRQNRAEVIVNRPGARPLIFLSALAPRMAGRIGQNRRFRDFAERFAAARQDAPQTPAERRVAERD